MTSTASSIFKVTGKSVSNDILSYNDFSKLIVVFGILPGSPLVLEEIFRKEDITDWGNGDSRSWSISTSTNYIGVRIYITKTNKSQSGGDYQTGFGNLRMTGSIGALQVPGQITDFQASNIYQDKIVCDWSLASGNPLPKYDLYEGPGDESDTLIAEDVYPGYEYQGTVGTHELYVKAINSMGSENSNTDIGEILQPRLFHLSVQSSSQPEIQTEPAVTIDYTDRGAGLWWVQVHGSTQFQRVYFTSNTNNQDITAVSLIYSENDMLTSLESMFENLTGLNSISAATFFAVFS